MSLFAAPERRPNPATACRVVLLTTTVCLGLVAPVAYCGWGWVGLEAAVTAGLCCCAGAVGGLGVAWWLRNTSRLVESVLAGMLIRMGLALTAALAVQLGGGPLAEAGFLYYLLVFYSVTLAAETTAVVRAWST